MKAEYDFSKAERGKFFRPGATLKSPIYLEDEVQAFVMERAQEMGVDPDELVNQVLQREMKGVEHH